MLWTLEAWGDCERSPCSDVLYSYLPNLHLCDRQVCRAAQHGAGQGSAVQDSAARGLADCWLMGNKTGRAAVATRK